MAPPNCGPKGHILRVIVNIKNHLQFVELHKYADAKTITKTVVEEFKRSNIYQALQQKLLSFTSDGENTVAGRKSGFAKRLEDDMGISLVKVHW